MGRHRYSNEYGCGSQRSLGAFYTGEEVCEQIGSQCAPPCLQDVPVDALSSITIG
ncbi:hypothetical protein GW17_00048948 [Ensete ventricosum]|nr:hypothetical protein GW17_00048948 [Ensete ventricosum]